MEQTRTRLNFCPVCLYAMDAATGVGHDRKPKPGDFSVCADCGALLCFGPALVLTLCTASDLAEFKAAQPEAFALLIKAQNAVRAAMPFRALEKTISTPRPPQQSAS
jgi:hypothetical protein